MAKVRVIGLRRDQAKVVAALHEAGLVEFKETGPSGLTPDIPGESYREVSEQLIRLRGIENYLKKSRGEIGVCEKISVEKALREAKELTIDARLAELGKASDEAKDRKRRLIELKRALAHFRNLDVDFSDLRHPRLKYSLGSFGTAKLHLFRKSLDSLTKNYSIVTRVRGEKVFALVAIEKGVEAGSVFGEAGFAETDISGLEGKPTRVLDELEKELVELEKKLSTIELDISGISTKHYCRVAQLREILEIEADRLEVVAKFGKTDELFAFEGFAPKSKVPEVRGCLSGAVGKNYLVQEGEAGHDAPTLLEHGKAAGPLQFLVEFYSLPNTGELDPTLLLVFTFPIIYGMMLGDVGYGLISLFISLLILRVFKKGLMAGFARLWAYAAVPTIIFGVIYDEWLGFSHSHLLELLGLGHAIGGMGLELPLYKGLSRIEDVKMLLALALITGFLQLLFGFALGVINDWGHHRKHSYAKIGWMGILAGGFFSVSIMFFGAFPKEWLYPFGGLFGIGVLLVLVFEGPMGLFEIPGLAGNVLSYARIAGVGLAGVVPAEFIINKLLLPKPEMGVVTFAIMSVAYVSLHVANAMLGMIESLAQGARLNLVEFYSKFYKGGGRKFSPFRVERAYTKR